MQSTPLTMVLQTMLMQMLQLLRMMLLPKLTHACLSPSHQMKSIPSSGSSFINIHNSYT